MRQFLAFLTIGALLLVLPDRAGATHNRAGEIHIEQIGNCADLTIRATVITYTKASAFAADRDSLEVFWGDGTKQWVYRVNGPIGGNGLPNGEVLANDIKRNLYVATHAYPARATYRISMLDPNRIDNILNVNFPNSVSVTFYIETVYTFLNPQFQGCNSTPFLLQPPIDFGCVGRPFIHNPNAFDPDGDSLSYHLIQPLQNAGQPVPKYLFPNQIGSGGPNVLTLDPVTGDLRWENPLVPGEYNIAFIIISYRNGVALDTTIRDMQVLVSSCNNDPPRIEAATEVCVIAGETLNLPVTATDPNLGQSVLLSATGGPFVAPFSAASFLAPTVPAPPPVNGLLIWPTACEEIRRLPWSIVFKAEDNDPGTPLVDLHTLRVTIVGPPPDDLSAQAGQNDVTLSWASPYACQDAANDYFRGFSVWRRQGSNPFPPDPCEPGLDGKGYTRIAFRQTAQDGGRYVFTDTDVEPGRTYCYRILADFALLSAAGNPFNQVASLPSEEICIQLRRNVPLLTTVSVESTGATDGRMEIVWTKPRVPDLDTLLFPGPYRYRLLRSVGQGTTNWQPVPGADFSAPAFHLATDTAFRFDEGLNTRDQPYSYLVEFYADGLLIGPSAPASSVFLQVASTDQRNILRWEALVPWVNYAFEVERQDPISGDWLTLAQTEEPEYQDIGLVNGQSYCYRIRAFGDYGIPDIATPLINLSQEACGIPLDTIPPCPPVLQVSNVCDSLLQGNVPDQLFNQLRWTNPLHTCPDQSDVAGYRIFLQRPGEAAPLLIAEIFRAEDTSYTHFPEGSLAGCYTVAALDSLGNVSLPSSPVCVDNCPDYRLPNTFTPNGDGRNDLFIPYPYRFVERVEFQVFNRWGNLVFETTDPDLRWDGRNLQGRELAEGVYYYVCTVFEQRIEGVVPAREMLKGYIQLIRN
jgi:gliding motility-associated-like protein